MEPDANVDTWAHSVIGAAIEVHRTLGPGFKESIYEEALAHGFKLRDIRFVRQALLEISYKGIKVGRNRMDFLVADCLVVELKSSDGMPPIYTSQVLSYLRASRLHLGLLINFNEILLKNGIRRVVLS